ncbi:Lamin Tail Domain [Nonomuraea solani]|uniref:Lamin Tail Domain n=1 Tax=Nonomuraea solani TaxID=1144553 RepID=A0A1H5ZLZ3_9ACTN|nr:lamin tail domain-containing protein [Nonomuraea solani]SEG36376.1 Lamin Tail Domain [Nonomuraea solani]
MRHALTAVAAVTVFCVALPAQAAAPAIQIVKIYYDSPGADLRSNGSLNAEYVTLLNTTKRAIDLEGWTVRDKTGYTYEFGPDVLLGPKKRITLRSGQGGDGTASVYWNRKQYVWNNDQDTAYVRNPAGRPVDSCSYKASTGSAYVTC